MLEKALSPKTKAVFIAHTLGNLFNIKAVKEFCDKHNLWLIEDNCDALGAEYTIDGVTKETGTIGDIGISSFYLTHHMTMGEGGAVYTNNFILYRAMLSFRDWGRDCHCLCADEKLPGFVEASCNKYLKLKNLLSSATDKVILPEKESGANASWFGFPITCKDNVDRNKVVQYIESKKIQTRMLFVGNNIKHPCFDEMRASGEGYRLVGELTNTDRILMDTFWIGVYPGLTDEMINYMANVIIEGLN